jgi:hypothetical protein
VTITRAALIAQLAAMIADRGPEAAAMLVSYHELLDALNAMSDGETE